MVSEIDWVAGRRNIIYSRVNLFNEMIGASASSRCRFLVIFIQCRCPQQAPVQNDINRGLCVTLATFFHSLCVLDGSGSEWWAPCGILYIYSPNIFLEVFRISITNRNVQQPDRSCESDVTALTTIQFLIIVMCWDSLGLFLSG